MAMRAGQYRGEHSPLLSRFQPHSLLCGQVWAGSGVMARGHVALSHRSLSVLQTGAPRSPDLTECSICQQNQTTLHVEEDDGKVFLHMAKKSRSCKNYPSKSVSSSWQHTVTWWTDYVFTLSMNMKHPSRFNPAQLSLSTRPIAEQIFVASSRGWAYRSIRMNVLILWRKGWLQWLTGHWNPQKQKNPTGISRGKLHLHVSPLITLPSLLCHLFFLPLHLLNLTFLPLLSSLPPTLPPSQGCISSPGWYLLSWHFFAKRLVVWQMWKWDSLSLSLSSLFTQWWHCSLTQN